MRKNKPITSDIIGLFFDSSNRVKKTPLHLSTIKRRLEEKYHPWQINDELKKLKQMGVLSSLVSRTKSIRKIIFYYPSVFDNDVEKKNQILKKIVRSCYWIEKYSDQNTTSIIGKHLHALVKAELRAQGFNIINEGRVRSYNGVKWKESKHSLDMIAEHYTKRCVVGVEIKNTLDIISKKEINRKIRMCKYFGITPLFACRWLKPYIDEIKNNNGFAWQFSSQLYPLCMEDLVKKTRKRFGFKMEVTTELPQHSVNSLTEYLKSF